MEHSVLHLLHSVFIFYLTLSDAQIPGGQENNSSSFSYETFDFEMEENVAGVGNESGVAQYRQAEPCDVDPCHHPQPPCRAPWQHGGCPCDTSPVRLTAPRLLAVVPVSESDVEVRWCSPRSSVRAFAVAYRAVDGEPAHNAGSSLLVHATWRSHVLRGLRPNGRYQVCVAAIGRSCRSRCWETERSFGNADAAAAATAEFTAPADSMPHEPMPLWMPAKAEKSFNILFVYIPAWDICLKQISHWQWSCVEH
ncbi:unnamed protein product [Lampetra fluviatilis]